MLLTAGFVFACSKETSFVSTTDKLVPATPQPAAVVENFQEYLLPKDQHASPESSYKLVQKESMQFVARFDSSCIYATFDPKNSGDINKLYGFSDCGSFHHENSARVGWAWNGRSIDLYAYCYADSVRSSRLLGAVNIGDTVTLGITPKANEYIFEMNGKVVTALKRGCNATGIHGYQLFPYFGGDETAPHDMHIFIKDL